MIGCTTISRRAALAASIAAIALVAPSGAVAQEASDSDAISGEQIVVTAQKREETLIEIPQSVTVVGGETLERQQADNFQDYLALIPSLSLQTATRGISRISLRGINTGGVASTVGVYIDEVPFGSSSGLANGASLAGDFDTTDLARLEVLRGPQGTLYGASSLGGVLRFITNTPDPGQFEARADASIEAVDGGGLGYSARGVVNVPIGDAIAIRATGFYRFDDGFIDTIGNNPIPTLLDPNVTLIEGSRVAEDINATETYGGRISALFTPSDRLSVRLTALLQDINTDASSVFEANPETLEPLYGDLTASQYHPEFIDSSYRIYSGTVDWDLGLASLLSATSYATFENNLQADLAFLLAPLVSFLAATEQLGVPPVTRPLSALQIQTVSTDKFSQELRLTSPESDSFEWLVGAYYTHENSAIDPQQIIAVEPGTVTPAPDIPVLGNAFLVSEYEEIAGFANATLHVTDRLEVTAGGRLSYNDQSATQELGGPLFGGVAAFEDAGSSETVFTYSVAPRYEFSDNASVYARVATGYRPGGPNVLPPAAPPGTPAIYDSDSLTSYEIGLKADTADDMFSIEVAAFYLDWQDIQLFAVINDTGVNANGGSATSKGIEFTATVRPTAGLTFSANGAYTDAELTEDTDPIVGGLDGDPLPYVPDYSLSLNGDYEWAVMGDATAYVGGTLSFTGDRSPDFGILDAAGMLREVPAYETVDLRAGIDAGAWSVEAFVRNLGNERGVTSLAGNVGSFPNGAIGVAIIRPRTIGLDVGVAF